MAIGEMGTNIFLNGRNVFNSKISTTVKDGLILASALRMKGSIIDSNYEVALITPVSGLVIKNIKAEIHTKTGSSGGNRINIFVPEDQKYGLPNWSNTRIEYVDGRPIKNAIAFEIFADANTNECYAELTLGSDSQYD